MNVHYWEVDSSVLGSTKRTKKMLGFCISNLTDFSNTSQKSSFRCTWLQKSSVDACRGMTRGMATVTFCYNDLKLIAEKKGMH